MKRGIFAFAIGIVMGLALGGCAIHWNSLSGWSVVPVAKTEASIMLGADLCYLAADDISVYANGGECPPRADFDHEVETLLRKTGYSADSVARAEVILSKYWVRRDEVRDDTPVSGITHWTGLYSIVGFRDWRRILRHELLHVAIMRDKDMAGWSGDAAHMLPIWDRCECRANESDRWPGGRYED